MVKDLKDIKEIVCLIDRYNLSEEITDLAHDILGDKGRYNTIDDFFIVKILQLPDLKEFNVEGHYHYVGKENDFTGLFKIGSNNTLLGDIRDPNSNISSHLVLGKIKSFDTCISLNFLKMPPHFLSVPIYYHLIKKEDIKNIEGTYSGLWTFNTDKDIIHPETLERPEYTNFTEISLLEIK